MISDSKLDSLIGNTKYLHPSKKFYGVYSYPGENSSTSLSCLEFTVLNNYMEDTIRMELEPFLYFNDFVCDSLVLEYYLYAAETRIVCAKIGQSHMIHAAYIKNYPSENKTQIKILLKNNSYYNFWSIYITKVNGHNLINNMYLVDFKNIPLKSLDAVDITGFNSFRLVPKV